MIASPGAETPPDPIETFIARWQGREGGQERANYQLFLTGLCHALGLPEPDPADATHEHNDYVFERVVPKRREEGDTQGRIDLYRKGAFVLEAKQSRLKGGKKEVAGHDDLFAASPTEEARGRRGAGRAWDVLMLNAKRQAEEYARALPTSHGWPPFILVCDVGHCIEVYADFSGQGKNYTQFPDRQSFRIYLEDLRRREVRERLQKIWREPQALDPTRIAAKATRDIAERLAAVSKALEAKAYPPEDVALFLMRCLFTMFAEDVKLLPEDSFRKLLADCRTDPQAFVALLTDLWRAMNEGSPFAVSIRAKVLRFNGNLFADAKVLPLGREEIGELAEASQKNWREVEPAIFGTLLEQALDPRERKRLGAHYTPRAYVERLVVATVIEPLREDWRNVQAAAEAKRGAGDRAGAATEVKAFHDRLCETRVLDPACGTGNFLYVALELMKRLEGEVLEALLDLGGQEALAGLGGHTVDPHQFLGLEKNARAAAIAELVLWIGYLQWHFRTKGGIPEQPILKAFRNIRQMDAVLTWDGYPLPQVQHASVIPGRSEAEGKGTQDAAEPGSPSRPSGPPGMTRREVYPNPRRPVWPEAEFIVGNPPFIGGKDLRARLGDEYAQALWAAHKHINESADFVMYWWDRAAEMLTAKGSPLRRFGLVTTNSITQEFSRRVIKKRMEGKTPVSLAMTIPDHPWTKATPDAAAVRIAMSVAQRGDGYGILHEVISEQKLDTDQPVIELVAQAGRINPDLTVGVDVTTVSPLLANKGLGSRGVTLGGSGFIVSPAVASHLGLGSVAGLDAHILPFLNGRDLTQKTRGSLVIDLFGIEETDVRKRFPQVYQHLLATVRAARQKLVDSKIAAGNSPTPDDLEYAENWWRFAKPRQEFRSASAGLSRLVATTRTAKHRIFSFLPAGIMPESEVIIIASGDAFCLAVLSSSAHLAWFSAKCGTLEDRPRYNNSLIFDPFPFPEPPEPLKAEIRAAAEELDAFRKARQAEHPGLTLTGMYNVLEKLKAGAPLTPDDERIREQGLVLILKELHERLDRLVFQAYGWPETLSDEEIVARLVVLNKERAAEERRGLVRWLRPEYQIPRFGRPADKQAAVEEGAQVAATLHVLEPKQKPSFPANAVEQTAAVFAALAAASEPLGAAALAATFRQGKRAEPKIRAVLESLARLGHLVTDDGQRFQLRRAA